MAVELPRAVRGVAFCPAGVGSQAYQQERVQPGNATEVLTCCSTGGGRARCLRQDSQEANVFQESDFIWHPLGPHLSGPRQRWPLIATSQGV